MFRWILTALVLAVLAAPSTQAAQADSMVFLFDADEMELQMESVLTGPDAAEFRQSIDEEGNSDGTVTATEMASYNSAHSMTYDDDQSDCFSDWDMATIDGKTPRRISEMAEIAKGATGATSSTTPVTRIESVVFLFPRPGSGSPGVTLRLSQSDSMAAMGCAMSSYFGNFGPGMYPGWGGTDSSDSPFGFDDASAQQQEASTSGDDPIRVEPRSGASMDLGSIRPTSLQSTWNGKGILADSDAERATLSSSKVTFTVRGGAAPQGFEGWTSGGSTWIWVAGGVSLAGVAAVLSTEVGRYQFLKWLLLIPGFTRLEKDEVLEHGKRDQLYQFIKTNPGPSFSDLRRELELSNGTLVHHLRILEAQEFVKSVRDGFRTRFYVRGPKVIPTSYITRTQQTIIDAIGANPGLTQKDLANVLGLPRESVSYHTKRLAQSGQLQVKQEGKWRRYWVKPAASGAGLDAASPA